MCPCRLHKSYLNFMIWLGRAEASGISMYEETHRGTKKQRVFIEGPPPPPPHCKCFEAGPHPGYGSQVYPCYFSFAPFWIRTHTQSLIVTKPLSQLRSHNLEHLSFIILMERPLIPSALDPTVTVFGYFSQ